MGKPLTITRTDRTSGELRAVSAKCRDGAQVRRLLALAMVLEGAPRAEAAACNGMDRQTLRDWVHRYNEGGVDALKNRESPGRTPYLTDAQMAELHQLVVDGPDLATDKVVRWRIADLGRRASEYRRHMAASAPPDPATATAGPSEERPRSRDGF
jgi:transposase